MQRGSGKSASTSSSVALTRTKQKSSPSQRAQSSHPDTRQEPTRRRVSGNIDDATSLTVTTMQMMTATQTLVKSTNMSATKTNDLDVLALKDADSDAGEHDGLVVLNVDDEDLNVLNNDYDDVDGMMIFQWSVNLSAVLANGDVDRNHELPRDTCSFVVRSVQR